ncbi:sigma factor regulator N-terminal domain-containing protein [Enterococcus sp. JM9B]|uniref:sigma factor regulator N-terminal domain-containing protein n=1 Tax=Enterococcus sp. JM9B TaxID=1857216 RepID=UPI0013751C25|nr:sigma factor regulator N-terminal domain-containing protein [Enterococcus sp. JM9B]KAF1300975.1 hypothetical protein BAU16_11390 [Enterococcus sp. JM9B]
MDLTKVLKKAKRKQTLKIIAISLGVALLVLIGGYRGLNFFAGRNSQELDQELVLHNMVAEPNVNVDSRVLGQSSSTGGTIVTHRSKNINGYLVPWSTLTSSYSLFNWELDYNDLVPGRKGETYAYDKQTKQKQAVFSLDEGDKKIYPDELADLAKLEDQVAEVALTFDKNYTYADIQEKIPDTLTVVWLYLFEESGSKQPFGFQLEEEIPTEDQFSTFIKNLTEYDKGKKIASIQTFLKKAKGKSFAEMPIKGVVVTGQTKNFSGLVDASFIKGSSVGVTTDILPYITPEK